MPAPAASGVPGTVDGCASRPELCKALHAANEALIAAAKANHGSNYVCTSAIRQPGCGATSPQPYFTDASPDGNPADVNEGRRLLDWYLKNLTCEALCKPTKHAQVCKQACGQGKDPGEFPGSGGLPAKPGNPTRLR